MSDWHLAFTQGETDIAGATLCPVNVEYVAVVSGAAPSPGGLEANRACRASERDRLVLVGKREERPSELVESDLALRLALPDCEHSPAKFS